MTYLKSSLIMLYAAVCVFALTAPLSVAQEDVAAPSAIQQDKKTADVEGLRLNFRGASLDAVLDYLSKEAGFTIVREADVDGRIDVWSPNPLSKDEAVDLLNTVLTQKGYAAIRHERTLIIVDRANASYRDIPVQKENDPAFIPKTDELVTQIIPVRYAEAMRLTDNLTPLLPSSAVMTANESSNAIVITDTQRNVRRMAEIVKALDTSISAVSEIRVFQLEYADAREVSQMINQLFGEQNQSSRSRSGSDRRMGEFIQRMRMGRGEQGRDAGQIATGMSEARQAASMVQAVADERTNSLVIAAPEEMMKTFEDLITQIDSVTEESTEVKVFPLRYADADEMAEIIEDVFEEDERRLSQSSRGGGEFGSSSPFFQRFMSSRGGGRGGGRSGGDDGGGLGGGASERQIQQVQVTAVADVRTNSVIVTAAEDMMEFIEDMVIELDSDPARDRKVFIYTIENADAENVQGILEDMFQGGGSSSSSQRSTSGTSSSWRSSSQPDSSSQSSSRGGGR